VDQVERLKDRLEQHPKVAAVSSMNEILGIHHNVHEFNYEGMESDRWVYFAGLMVDADFVKTFGLELVAGRDFFPENGTDDTLAVLINETMVQELKWGSPQEAIGKRFRTPFGNERVVGVLKDFHVVSFKEQIQPFVLDITVPRNRPFFTKNIAVRISPQDIPATLSFIAQEWNQVAPMHPFTYSFLEDEMNHLYQDEDLLSDLVGYFSILAVFIACLGLFALASFTTERRTHEIGIRKVLGSSVFAIIQLLAWDFLKLVLLANLVAWVVAWAMLEWWLSGFAYRIELSWWIFLLASFGVMGLALLTVAYHSIRAGLADPAHVLRDE
jgi:putative ABC transport system permease protein